VDGFEGGAVFPGHFDDAVDVDVCHVKGNNRGCELFVG
jgi:hypothetical protein